MVDKVVAIVYEKKDKKAIASLLDSLGYQYDLNALNAKHPKFEAPDPKVYSLSGKEEAAEVKLRNPLDAPYVFDQLSDSRLIKHTYPGETTLYMALASDPDRVIIPGGRGLSPSPTPDRQNRRKADNQDDSELSPSPIPDRQNRRKADNQDDSEVVRSVQDRLITLISGYFEPYSISTTLNKTVDRNNYPSVGCTIKVNNVRKVAITDHEYYEKHKVIVLVGATLVKGSPPPLEMEISVSGAWAAAWAGIAPNDMAYESMEIRYQTQEHDLQTKIKDYLYTELTK